MKPFVVILSVRPAVRVPRHLGYMELKFPEPEGLKRVIITKIEEKDEFGTVFQTGLLFRVFLEANSLKEAINSAKSLCDGIVSFMTLITGRGMDIPREELAYELTTSTQERDFLQVFYDIPLKSLSRRQLDPETLISFIEKSTKLDSSFFEHIARAVRWYRLGAMVTDIFDQFNCFWIGIEALNPLLQQKLSIADDPIMCPKCKHRWVAIPTVSGIRVFFQEKLKKGGNLYREIRELRNSIVHSTKGLRDLQDPVSKYAPETGEVLFRAICFLLGFEEWDTMKHGSILKEFPMRGELQGVLVGGDPSSLGPEGEDPHFELHHQITRSSIKENGTLDYKGQSSFTAHLNPKVKFTPKETRFYGDSEMKGKITSKTLVTANGKETPI